MSILNGNKYPNLIYLQLNIGSILLLNKIQLFLNNTQSIRILSLNFNFGNMQSPNNNNNNNINLANKKTFIILTNIEILALGLNKYAKTMLNINYNICKDSIKYISIVNGGDSIVSLFNGINSNNNNNNYTICKQLKYICILDYQLFDVLKQNGIFLWQNMNNNNNNNQVLLTQKEATVDQQQQQQQICMIEKNGYPKFYAPYMEQSNLFQTKKFHFETKFPDFNQLKQDIECHKTRKLLRYLHDSQKMYYLLPFFDNIYFTSSGVCVQK